jgi:hypothetical protein
MSLDIDQHIYPVQSGARHWTSTSYADLQIFDISGVMGGIVDFAFALKREAASKPGST